jgi:hypothetical protein
MISFNFSEEIIQYSRTFAPQVQMSWNQAHAPSSSRAFQRHQEHDLKHPSLVDLITTKQNKTKQNKLPSFIDRYAGLATKTMANHLEQSQLYWVSFDPFCVFVCTKM